MCLYCKCLCMTCRPSQNQICYFHCFREEKQIGRKPQKCRQSQHHHLKEIWTGGMRVSDKTQEIVLEYKYSDPVSPPRPQTTAPMANTLTHTNCYLQESIYAHVALMGFTWGSMWVTDRKKGAGSERFLMFSVSPKQSKFSTVLVRRLEHNRAAVMWRCKRYSNITWFVSTIHNLGHVAWGCEITNWR